MTLEIKTVSHGGGTEGFSTLMMMDLEKKIGVVVLTNVALRDYFSLGVDLIKVKIKMNKLNSFDL